MAESKLRAEFEQKGFIVLPNLIEQDLIDEAVSTFDEINEYFEKSEYDPFDEFMMRHRTDQGALYDLYFRHPEYQRLTTHRGLVDKLVELIGPDLFLYDSALVYKPKLKANEVPWHQDFMNRVDEPTKYVIWVALDDVTIDNGALKFIPESHKLGFLNWFRVKGETHHTRLVLDGVDVDNYEYALMKKGDVLVFHHLLIHGSDRISSDQPRRAYRFSVQGFEQIFSPRCVPVVLSGGGAKTYKNASKKSLNKPKWKLAINNFGKKLASY